MKRAAVLFVVQVAGVVASAILGWWPLVAVLLVGAVAAGWVMAKLWQLGHQPSLTPYVEREYERY